MKNSYYLAHYLDLLCYICPIFCFLAFLPGAKCVVRKSGMLSGAYQSAWDF